MTLVRLVIGYVLIFAALWVGLAALEPYAKLHRASFNINEFGYGASR